MSEVILIPRVNLPTPRAHGAMAKDNGLGVQRVDIYIEPAQIDLVQQYRSWYGAIHPVPVGTEQINRGFWSHADFARMAAEFPTDYILVEDRQSSGWILHFVDGEAARAFSAQLARRQLENPVIMPVGFETDEVRAWLDAHVRQPHKIVWETGATRRVCFKDADEAIFFKLRWYQGTA